MCRLNKNIKLFLHSETVVINDFYAASGAWVGAEQLLTQLAAFTLVTDDFCRLPVFSSSRLQSSSTVFREGTLRRIVEYKSKKPQLSLAGA
jgi:hypothetical protein